jgi:hypothetical protein
VFRRVTLIAALILAVGAAVVMIARRHSDKPAPGSDRRGTIEFDVEEPESRPLSSVSVLFVDWARANGCSRETIGGCRLEKCTLAGTTHYPDAGLLSITGGKLPPTGLKLRPSASGEYSPFAQERALWQTGNRLSVSAAGGSVPAFDASVVVPPTVDVTGFVPPKRGAEREIDRTSSLDFAWSSTGAQEIAVILAAATHAPERRMTKLLCSAPAKRGKLHIPSAALGALPQVTAMPDVARLSVWSKNVERVHRGDFLLSIAASMPARAGGRAAAGMVTLR